MAKQQDTLTSAKEAFADAKEDMDEQHARMLEDLRFSNPSEPKQWDDLALQLRKGRPCQTFDRTNQFVMQVVNDARQNKPAIKCLPADSRGTIEVAEKLNGMLRHVEYVSRAGTAYDTGLEMAARTGLGWIRVIPKVMRPETNEQEVRILRVHDPLSVMLQAGWTEPDGSDAMCGFAETLFSKAAFKAAYPKAKEDSWESDGWFAEDSVRICEYFEVTENKQNNIVAQLNGQTQTFGEDDYWREAKPAGAQLVSTFESKQRKVSWVKMSGCEVLEETEFPSQYLPIVPVLGYELWIQGKRYLCGIPRRLMDSQRAYNYSQSALLEAISLQPKAPIMVPAESTEGHEEAWAKLNTGTPAYLPYNANSELGPLPPPSRLSPPTFPAAFANLGQIAAQDMEAAIGMFKANLGQQGNETSGKAIRARQQEGDTANFHYIDNLSRAIEQLGRVVVDMIPRIYDTQRQARIVGEDGTHDFVEVDPSMQEASRKQGKKTVAINPSIGAYDVRVEVGPSYTSLREEAAQNIIDIAQGNPALAAAMAPMLIKFRDMPEAEKMSKVAMALLPPPVQQAYNDDEDGPDISPEAQQQIAQLQQQVQQLSHALENAAHEAEEAESQKMIDTAKMQIDAYKAETDRLKVTAPAMDANQISALVQQLVVDMLGTDVTPGGGPSPLAPPPPSPPGDTGQTSPPTNEPATAGFSSPE